MSQSVTMTDAPVSEAVTMINAFTVPLFRGGRAAGGARSGQASSPFSG
jgi:hypothetical protein